MLPTSCEELANSVDGSRRSSSAELLLLAQSALCLLGGFHPTVIIVCFSQLVRIACLGTSPVIASYRPKSDGRIPEIILVISCHDTLGTINCPTFNIAIICLFCPDSFCELADRQAHA
eukprot:6189015-Pleurochrysis_carterae.AAC.2